MSSPAIQPHPTLAQERVLAVISPANLGRLDEIRFQLARVFPLVEIASPESLEQLARCVFASDDSCRIVLAVGGDGTMHQVLKHCDPQRQILGLLPAGTGNDFARNLGFVDSWTLEQAVAHLTTLVPRASDLCSVNGIRYINSAGFGLDTETVKVREAHTGILHNNYTLAFLVALRGMRPLAISYECRGTGADGKAVEHRGAGSFYWVLAMNSRDIGRGTRMAPQARLDDGLLDMVLIRAIPKLRMLFLLPKAIKGRHIGQPGIDYAQVSELDCHLDHALETLAIDGEIYHCGTSTVSFRVETGGLTLLRPG